jgi:hypothetical protein
VDSIGAVGTGWSSLIAIHTRGDTLPFIFCFVENRFLAGLRVRTRARARLVAKFDDLRVAATVK